MVFHIKIFLLKMGALRRFFEGVLDSNHEMPVASNLLEQKFTATKLNQIWLTDITYIHTDEGWLYLAGHKDIFSCDLVGLRDERTHDQKPGQPVVVPCGCRETSATWINPSLGSRQPVLRA